ncbi:MAG: glutathione S-transferase family protein [Xanthomonadales bacterium]
MITLYWCPRTRASRALWMLEETGAPFRTRLVDIRNPETKQDPDFVKASPMGKVPALMDTLDNGTVYMADSAAICLYLADRYASGRLAPTIDDAARGRYLYWMTYTPGAIEPAMMEKFNGLEVSPTSSGWGNFDIVMRVLEEGLAAGPWIMGGRFTAADVLLGSSVNFMRQFGLLGERPVLDAYLERCLERPAYAAALAREGELDDA